MAVWVVHLLPRMATRIAFHAQTFRIQPVMRKIRSGISTRGRSPVNGSKLRKCALHERAKVVLTA